MTERIPVLLDTDLGSDIDDALALAYLLKQPRCELLGVTTVTGQPEVRAGLVHALCSSVGRHDIPIHPGAGQSLLAGNPQPDVPQAEPLGTLRRFERDGSAVEFLRRTIRAHPHEITLLAIGPLTNIALLFAIDPEIPELLRQLVMMGGRFFYTQPGAPTAEWNIACDPHAAAIVFAAPVAKLVAVGLDVTLSCRLGADECRRRLTAGGSEPLRAMTEVWFRDRPEITFHDPLAAALLFKPDLCAMAEAHVDVDLANGITTPRPDAAGGLRLAQRVAPALFFEHYFQVVGNQT